MRNLVTIGSQSKTLSYLVLFVSCPSARSNLRIADLHVARASAMPDPEQVLDASGLIGSGAKHPTSFRGNIRLHNLSSHSPAGAKNAFSVDRLTAAASVDSRLDRWELAAVEIPPAR